MAEPLQAAKFVGAAFGTWRKRVVPCTKGCAEQSLIGLVGAVSDRNGRARCSSVSPPVERGAKVCFDVTAALLLLLFLSPLLLIIAIAVGLDGGPILYSHRRVGAGGRPFGCLKFRSMVADGDAVLAEHLRTDAAAAREWAATRKLRDDPRVTRVGALLRQTSLDELPQLFNVLRLEMSLVGPRPIVEGEMEHYADDISYYLAARPGLTGVWQISGRSNTSYARRVELDTSYVRNWSMRNDIAILAKTVPAVLKRNGAL